jgi:hypothetical protein
MRGMSTRRMIDMRRGGVLCERMIPVVITDIEHEKHIASPRYTRRAQKGVPHYQSIALSNSVLDNHASKKKQQSPLETQKIGGRKEQDCSIGTYTGL